MVGNSQKIQEVFKLILEMMNFPSDLLGSIISNVMQAFEAIRNDPVGFLLNMLAAVKLGFSLIDQTKVITAASELARNTVLHGGGGTLCVRLRHCRRNSEAADGQCRPQPGFRVRAFRADVVAFAPQHADQQLGVVGRIVDDQGS